MHNLCNFDMFKYIVKLTLLSFTLVHSQQGVDSTNIAFSNKSPNLHNSPRIFLENPNTTHRNLLLKSGQYWENYVFQGSEPGMNHVRSIEHYIPFSYIPEYHGEFDLWPKFWIKHLNSMPKNMLHHVAYILYTPHSSPHGELIIPWNINSMRSSLWNSSAETKILIHDYQQNATMQQMPLQLKDAYFEMNRTYNILLINWGGIAKEPYFEASLYADLIGKHIGTVLVILWNRDFIHTLFDVHIIGFGMGAHIAGCIGATVKSKINARIGRITGLDPLGPGYYDTKNLIRLSYDDAAFVDVIHTNGGIRFLSGELGFPNPLGDADFFPNGGITQPICENVKPMYDLIPICNHLKAVDYFKRSILGEIFRGCKCDGWGEYDSDSCKCVLGAFMGDNVQPTARGKYYLHVFEFTLFEMFKKEQEEEEAMYATNSTRLPDQ